MSKRRFMTSRMWIAAVAAALMAADAMAQEGSKAPATAGGLVILEAGKTFWRYYEVWQNDVVKTESNTLVALDLTKPVIGKNAKGEPMPDSLAWREYWEPRKGQTGIRPAQRTIGAPFPAEGWEKPDFDDSLWSRDRAVQRQAYRAIQSMYLRGKFEVADPAQTSDLKLTLGFRGGAVVYLNGKEVKRAFLPDGKIENATLAKEYPKSVYLRTDGALIDQTPWGTAQTYFSLDETVVTNRQKEANQTFTNETNVANYKERYRKIEVQIPATLLRKGVNVLAVLIRRAPADIVMYTGAWPKPKYFDQIQWYYSLAWNRCDLDDLKLVATGKADGIVPNVARPKGPRVWVHYPIHQPLTAGWFGDPNEGTGTLRLSGLRNGTYSGELVVNSTDPIRDLKAGVSELKGPAEAVIPASAVTIGFAQATDYTYFGQFDTLASSVTNVINSTFWRWRYGYRQNGAVVDFPPIQPIWISVKVPKTAVPGEYTGKVTVTMADQKPVDVPVNLKVLGTWVLPDAQDSVSYIGFLESAEASANTYRVPLWSDAHWKLIDQVFEKLGELGVKEVYVPVTARSHMDNAESMVRWIPSTGSGQGKQPDPSAGSAGSPQAGSGQAVYKHDFSIAEKYVDTALKHLKNIRMACIYVYAHGNVQKRTTRFYTEFDPKTGVAKELEAPEWGTPEAQSFWKPVIEGTRQMLAKKGLEKVTMVGMPTDFCDKHCWDDVSAMFPDMKWVVRSHWHPKMWWDGKRMDKIGFQCNMHGSTLSVQWDPDSTRPENFGWQVSPFPGIVYPAYARWKDNREFNQGSTVAKYRSSVEGAILSTCNKSTYPGLGSYGGDFWNGWRYDVGASDTGCGRIKWIIGADKAGPVHTTRSRMMQEALQDAEIRILLEDTLVDEAKKAKLGIELSARCRAILDDRTRLFCYLSMFYDLPMNTFDPNGTHWGKGLPVGWDEQTVALYQAMDEVQKALGKQNRHQLSTIGQ